MLCYVLTFWRHLPVSEKGGRHSLLGLSRWDRRHWSPLLLDLVSSSHGDIVGDSALLQINLLCMVPVEYKFPRRSPWSFHSAEICILGLLPDCPSQVNVMVRGLSAFEDTSPKSDMPLLLVWWKSSPLSWTHRLGQKYYPFWGEHEHSSCLLECLYSKHSCSQLQCIDVLQLFLQRLQSPLSAHLPQPTREASVFLSPDLRVVGKYLCHST